MANDSFATKDQEPQSFLVYSKSEAIYSEDGAGFWSNDLGWTTMDLATKFSQEEKESIVRLPSIGVEDATWIHFNSELSLYVLRIVERNDDDDEQSQPEDSAAIYFDCFAEDLEHAKEQAANAYPGCKILGEIGNELEDGEDGCRENDH